MIVFPPLLTVPLPIIDRNRLNQPVIPHRRKTFSFFAEPDLTFLFNHTADISACLECFRVSPVATQRTSASAGNGVAISSVVINVITVDVLSYLFGEICQSDYVTIDVPHHIVNRSVQSVPERGLPINKLATNVIFDEIIANRIERMLFIPKHEAFTRDVDENDSNIYRLRFNHLLSNSICKLEWVIDYHLFQALGLPLVRSNADSNNLH